MTPVRMAQVLAIAFALLSPGSSLALGPMLKLTVHRGYLPGYPTLVRVERIADVVRADRLTTTTTVDRALWDGEAFLTVNNPAIILSTNRVMLRNGLGSAFVMISGAGDFILTATQGTLSASQELRDLSEEPVATIGGLLPGTTTTWTGIIRVTNDVTVPAGHVLTILSNTLVLVTGVASGTVASDILVSGSVQSLGTADYPVTITSANPGWHWGQIRHNSAQPSLYQYTSISRAGRGTGEGHTGTVPAIRPSGSSITFDHCNLTDFASPAGTPGKVMYGLNSNLRFIGCLMSRARMGPELQGTALMCSNTWFLEFRGPDDSDGIYIHTQGAGQQVLLTDSVIGFGDDDGIDTLGPVMTLERCIIRNINSGVDPDGKGVSVFHGATHLKRCLIVDCITSVSAKWSSGATTVVTINESSVLGVSNSVVAAYKDNARGPNIDFRITNSILRSIDAVKSDFGPTNFTIAFCNISEDWPGEGNQTGSPEFVGGHDYHLQGTSPCIDTGNPVSPLDADGSRIDLGAFTLVPPAPVLSASVPDELLIEAFPNRFYVLESSDNLVTWTNLGAYFQSNAVNRIQDPSSAADKKFYRSRLAP